MNFLTLANAGLQTIATAMVAGGAYLLFTGDNLVNGIVLVVLGIVSYVVYEKLPESPK
jgi:hypothetical protein